MLNNLDYIDKYLSEGEINEPGLQWRYLFLTLIDRDTK